MHLLMTNCCQSAAALLLGAIWTGRPPRSCQIGNSESIVGEDSAWLHDTEHLLCQVCQLEVLCGEGLPHHMGRQLAQLVVCAAMHASCIHRPAATL